MSDSTKARNKKEDEIEGTDSNIQASPSSMAEPESPSVRSPATKKQSSDLPAQNKIFSSFLYKAVLLAIFVALLPLFPPQNPGSTNPTLLSRTWELLHLLLVGIAVSYGLFSQRNADPEADKDKDGAFVKADSPHSYVSRMLQISPVFDDDTIAGEQSKAETWSSQYHSTDPLVVENKPLLLPVRSLRNSRAQSPDSSESPILDSPAVVLPSPIPWRSRSMRMEVGEEGAAMAANSQIPAVYARAGSFSSGPRVKMNDYSVRAESFYGVAPPPAPPPPPRPFSHGSISFDRREVKRSFKDELNDLTIKERGVFKNTSLNKPESTSSLRSKETQSAEKLQPKFQAETKKKMIKKVAFLEKTTLDDSETDEGSDSSENDETKNTSTQIRAAETKENEVDKKADEFIAKFREQIRLQRLESIKKSSRNRSIANP